MQKLLFLAKRAWHSLGRLWSALFVHPASRISIAVTVTTVLVLGGRLQDNPNFGAGWLPGWYSDVYLTLAAVLSAQPILAGITDAVTKRRIKSAIREGLDEGLGKLVERVRDIARISVGTGWTNREARAFERHAVEALQHLCIMAGVPDPRICFYAISTTDDTETDSTDNPVVHQLTYVHHFPKQRPTAKFIRGTPESEGMFVALDTGQPSRVEDRPGYDPENHHWRSALRVPVQHEQVRWGVLTLDSPQKGATNSGCADILEFGAALIGVARLCEDSKDGPTDDQIYGVFSRLKD